jgi:hypothetical protein
MRPTYETNDDKIREAEVLAALSVKWRCESIPADKFCAYDAVLKRDGKVMGFVEIKCRNITIDQYPSLIISKAKMDAIVSLCHRHPDNPIPLLVASLIGRIVGTTIEPGRYKAATGGRKDRGDHADIETVYQIPWRLFKIITQRGRAEMMKKGDIPFSVPDSDEAGGQARAFCQSRGLTPENAAIFRRGGNIIVEVKAPCSLKL